MEELRKKLKEINNQIDLNVGKSIKLKDELIKKKIRFNDWTSPLLQELESIHKQNDALDKEYDEIREKINALIFADCEKKISNLKELYQDKKYRIINKETNEETFTNNIENYLYNFDYEIRLILENREYRKQGKIVNPYWWNVSGDYMVETFKDDDTRLVVEKRETFTSEGELISIRITKVKRSISISYLATKGNISVFNICDHSLPSIGLKFIVNMQNKNRDGLQMDIIKKAKSYFAKDKDIMELIEKYE